MADGIKKLRKVQLGRETTAGTSVAATAVVRITGATIEDASTFEFPDEDVGLLVQTERNYVPMVGAKIAWPDNPATFEQLPYILEAGIKKVTTGATDTGGAGKIYVYPFPTATPNVIQTYTVEGGDNIQEEEIEYAFVQGFKLSGAPKEVVNASAEWVGRQVTLSTFTPGLAIPAVEEILFQKTKLYIDNASGTLGTTLVSSTLMGFTLDIDTGLREVYSGDGQLYFDRTKNVGPSGTLEVTFEHNASALAEKAAWRAKTTRAIRLVIEGSAFTAGTGYSKKTLKIDVCGRWLKFDKIDEQDGNDIVTGTLQIGYNATQALWGKITVVNMLASIP
jgi:hypothetical protein